MDDRSALSKFVCCQNIRRYKRLLRTELTDLERAFIKRRLAEEEHSLQLIEAQRPPRAVVDGLKSTYVSVKGAIAAALLNPFEFFACAL